MEKYLQKYAARVAEALCGLDWERLSALGRAMAVAIRDGKRIFVFGNGACAAASSHFACDTAKGMLAGEGIPRVRTLCLNDCVPLLTAWANDSGYEEVFRQPLENFLETGDLVMGLSASGNSPNVLKALEFARARGGITATIVGKGGGRAAEICEHVVLIKSSSYEEVEDVIVAATHMLKMLVLDNYRQLLEPC